METQLTIFVALTAVAIFLQAGVLLALYLSVSRMEKDTRRVRKQLDERLDPILGNIHEITSTVRDNSRRLFDDLTNISSDARRQMAKFDILTDEVADRLRTQVVRLDALLGEALDNVEQAGSAVRDRVAGPMREAAAVLQGVKSALQKLGGRRKPKSGRPSDEELFI